MSELDAVETQVQHFAEGAHEQGLAETGHAFEQDVAAREHGHERAVHDQVVADDDLGNLGAQGGVALAESRDLFFSVHKLFFE
jgi:hypothetical protein